MKKKTAAFSIGTTLIIATFVLCVLCLASRDKPEQAPRIATRQELISQGVLLPVGAKLNPSSPVKAEAEPELSKEAKETLQREELLKQTQDEVKRLQGNPYETIIKYSRKQEKKIKNLTAMVNELSKRLDEMENKVKKMGKR